MKKSTVVSMMFSLVIVLLAVITVIGNASAQSISSSLGLAPYPSKGQSAEQQSKDEGECYAWAKQQTGIDPVAVASTPTQQQQAEQAKTETLQQFNKAFSACMEGRGYAVK